jgi:predicted nucleic acid-binding protein
MIVIDTCIVFHLFNETSQNLKAQKLIEKSPHIILPPIWQEEYANILIKESRKNLIPRSSLLDNYDNVVDQLAPHEIVVNKKEAFRIALEANISSYDAQFVELAARYSIWLVTEDKELIKKNSRIAISMEDFLLK